jgi:hypothetical protein
MWVKSPVAGMAERYEILDVSVPTPFPWSDVMNV